MQITSCDMPGWMKHNLKSRFWEEISITSDMQVTPPLWQKAEEELKSLLIEGEGGEWKSWLKTQHSKTQDHGIWSHYFMANRKTMETVSDFIFLVCKIMVDGGYSHEIKKKKRKESLLLRRQTMTNLDSILKGRDLTLPTRVRLVKAMVFPVVMYGYKSRTKKKDWVPKNWCLWAVVLEKTLESSLDCKEIQPVNPKGS